MDPDRSVDARFFGKSLKLLVRCFGDRIPSGDQLEKLRQTLAEVEAIYRDWEPLQTSTKET